jgi:intracellular multiplication protein IcmG
MDNDSEKSGQEEEYRFDDEETSSNESMPKESLSDYSAVSSDSSGFKPKYILIAVVAIVAAFFIYKLGDSILARIHLREASIAENKVTRAATQIAIPAAQPAVTTFPQTSGVQQPASTIQATAASSTDVAQLTNKVAALEQQGANYKAAIDKLTAQTSNLQDMLTHLTIQVTNLNDNVQSMSNKITAQEAARQAAKQAVQRQVAAAKKKPVPIYYVKAMVPGRAWLVAQHGRTLTVSIGDNLPGYGVVSVIDPQQGTLTTSAGAIIGYSPNDS